MCKIDAERIERLLTALKTWSETDPRIRGLALVGSWGDADRQHAEADLDVVLLAEEPSRFRCESEWMAEIDWQAAGLGVGHWSECDYGAACSRHLKFADGAEIEVSFVPPSWAAVDPIDAVTRRVAGSGMRVVYDPDGLLGRLVAVL